MNLEKLSLEELTNLKKLIEQIRLMKSDGYVYICKIYSHGSYLRREFLNKFDVIELCSGYNGDNGHVDVFTTNPDLSFHNEGSIFLIKSKEDFERWELWNQRKHNVEYIEEYIKSLDEDDECNSYINREEFEIEKKKFEETVIDFVEPKPIN